MGIKIAFIAVVGLITYYLALSFGAGIWQAFGIEMILTLSLIMLVRD